MVVHWDGDWVGGGDKWGAKSMFTIHWNRKADSVCSLTSDESILLLFSPIFLSSNFNFFYRFCSKLLYFALSSASFFAQSLATKTCYSALYILCIDCSIRTYRSRSCAVIALLE